MGDSDDKKKAKGCAYYLGRVMATVTGISVLTGIISNSLDIDDHFGCHKAENSENFIEPSDNDIDNITSNTIENSNEVFSNTTYISTDVGLTTEYIKFTEDEKWENINISSENTTYVYDSDNITSETTQWHEDMVETEEEMENIVGYDFLIFDIDGKALCNTQVKIETQDGMLYYKLNTDDNGYAYFDLNFLFQALGKSDKYIVSKSEFIAGSERYRKIGYLSFSNSDLSYSNATIFSGIQLRQPDGRVAVNWEIQIMQGDSYLISRTNSDGMLYLSELDAGFTANSETSIWISYYDEGENNYIWRGVGTTYLESMISDVKYYDYYFD